MPQSRRRALSAVAAAALLAAVCAQPPQVESEPKRFSPEAAKRARLVLGTTTGITLAKKIGRGRPPPLRSVLGAREEATLVDEPPPGPLAQLARAFVLLMIFMPVILTAPFALVPFFRSRVWFWLIKSCLASAGTAFIKWGQWAACRPDMFPERLCAQLADLHSRAPVHGFAHTRREVERSLGARLEEVFESFDEAPLASGSIAQVHRATYKGRAVAVKVRHPAVVSRIVVDFALMNYLASASERIGLRWLNLRASVGQFSDTMVAQTRLDIEGEHLDRFNWNFGTGQWRDCDFPRVLRPNGVAPTPSVLVESFEPGELVARYTVEQTFGTSDAAALDPRLAHFIVSRGEDLYLKMLLVDNLMHADMHPGNILLDSAATASPTGGAAAGGPRRASPRIVMLDVGMVARLTKHEAEAFIGLLQAIGAGDGRAAARVVLRFSEAPQEYCSSAEERAAFAEDMHALFLERCRGYGTNVQFGEVLRGVLSLVRRHRVSLDANYMTLVMNVLCLESMALVLLPGYNVLDAAKPLLVAHKRLPRPLFRLLLPTVQSLKRLSDRWWAARHRG